MAKHCYLSAACSSTANYYKYKKQLQKIEKKVGMEYQKAHKQGYRILSKISDTLIVRTPKYVIFLRSNCTGHGNFKGFPPL